MRDGGVDDAELARARTDFLAGEAFGLETAGARANRINEYAHYTGDAGYLPKDIGRYEGVTAADVRDVARSLMPPGKRVVVVVRPTKGAPLCGRLVRGTP